MPLLTILGTFPEAKKSRPTIGPIEITCSINETHSQDAEITDSPIETGSDISDHRRVRAPALSIDGVISDAATTSRAEVDSRGNVKRRPGTPQGFTANEAYTQLQELFEGDVLFEVVTSLRHYERMHFTKFSVKRDKTTDAIISFSADMRQIEIVLSEKVSVVPNAADSAKVSSTAKKGKKQTTAVDENDSILHSIFGDSSKSSTGFKPSP